MHVCSGCQYHSLCTLQTVSCLISLLLLHGRLTCQCFSTLIRTSQRTQPWPKWTPSRCLTHFSKPKRQKRWEYNGKNGRMILQYFCPWGLVWQRSRLWADPVFCSTAICQSKELTCQTKKGPNYKLTELFHSQSYNYGRRVVLVKI